MNMHVFKLSSSRLHVDLRPIAEDSAIAPSSLRDTLVLLEIGTFQESNEVRFFFF